MWVSHFAAKLDCFVCVTYGDVRNVQLRKKNCGKTEVVYWEVTSLTFPQL